MKQQHQSPQQRENAAQSDPRDADPRDAGNDRRTTARDDDAAPRTGRASHVSSTDAQYGTHSSAGAPEHANADPARSGQPPKRTQPTRGGAQTGLTGSIDQLDSQAQNMQRPGGANPGAQSSRDWQAQRGDEGNLPDTASEQARANAAGPGRVTQDGGGSVTVDRGEEGNLDQARSPQGGSPATTTGPGQGPGEAHGASKYNASANEQDRLSPALGGQRLREPPAGQSQSQSQSESQSKPGSASGDADPPHAGRPRQHQKQR